MFASLFHGRHHDVAFDANTQVLFRRVSGSGAKEEIAWRQGREVNCRGYQLKHNFHCLVRGVTLTKTIICSDTQWHLSSIVLVFLWHSHRRPCLKLFPPLGMGLPSFGLNWKVWRNKQLQFSSLVVQFNLHADHRIPFFQWNGGYNRESIVCACGFWWSRVNRISAFSTFHK